MNKAKKPLLIKALKLFLVIMILQYIVQIILYISIENQMNTDYRFGDDIIELNIMRGGRWFDKYLPILGWNDIIYPCYECRLVVTYNGKVSTNAIWLESKPISFPVVKIEDGSYKIYEQKDDNYPIFVFKRNLYTAYD